MRNPWEYKKIAQSSLESRCEEVAWAQAKEQTQSTLIKIAAKDATRAEIDAATTQLKEQARPVVESMPAAPKDIQVVTETGQRLPASEFFGDRRGESPFTIAEWCHLPIRPVLVPNSESGKDPKELAEFLLIRQGSESSCSMRQ